MVLVAMVYYEITTLLEWLKNTTKTVMIVRASAEIRIEIHTNAKQGAGSQAIHHCFRSI
jgi:hypothetical protein